MYYLSAQIQDVLEVHAAQAQVMTKHTCEDADSTAVQTQEMTKRAWGDADPAAGGAGVAG